MAITKSYTDLEQSKKLAEILPSESADMYYEYIGIPVINVGTSNYNENGQIIPCWSLAALLGILPDDCGVDKEDGKYVASYLASNECGTYTSDNPVDACVDMIEKLHELNLL